MKHSYLFMNKYTKDPLAIIETGDRKSAIEVFQAVETQWEPSDVKIFQVKHYSYADLEVK